MESFSCEKFTHEEFPPHKIPPSHKTIPQAIPAPLKMSLGQFLRDVSTRKIKWKFEKKKEFCIGILANFPPCKTFPSNFIIWNFRSHGEFPLWKIPSGRTTFNPFTRNCGEGKGVIPWGIVVWPFNYAEQNGSLKILTRWLWEKRGVGES